MIINGVDLTTITKINGISKASITKMSGVTLSTPPSFPSPSNAFDAGNSSSYPGSGATWYNISGSNNATLYNGVTYDTDGGGCLIFDGSNDYGDIPYDSTFDFSTGNYTINVWVKYSGGAPLTIISKDTSGANFDWCMYLPDPSNMYNYSNGTSTNVHSVLTPGLDANTWYQLTISSISGYISMYMNGVLQNTPEYMSVSNANTTALTLGSVSWNNPALFFTGALAIVEIYNVGLTDTEVTTYFDNTKARFGY